MLIDTHAHLDFPDFSEDLDAVLERAAHAGVSRIITISTTLPSCRRAMELCMSSELRTPSILQSQEVPQISATIGIHPLYVDQTPDNFLDELRSMAMNPCVVGIGETGLDYHRSAEPAPHTLQHSEWIRNRERQLLFFTKQLDLAVETGLNVVVHQRDSWDDTMRMVRPYAGKLKAVFHCFGGTLKQAEELVGLGFFVSFTGIATFKNAASVHETASRLPAGCFFLETDCPFLAPAPHRGKRCEPSHTRLTAECIARLRGETLEELCEHTSAAAAAFFQRR